MELMIGGYGEAGQRNLIKCDEKGNVIWSDTIESPSFVCVKGDRMFAVTEKEECSWIHSYVKEGEGYRRVDSALFNGGFLCHVNYSPKHNMVFGACWGTGHVLYATLDDEGRFLKTASLLQTKRDPEGLTRAHFVHVNQAEDTLMVNNVGTDIIYFYAIENGEIREKDRIYTEVGQHPRHSVYNHDESLLYVITELSNEVLVYKMPEKQLLQRITTLPSDWVGKSHTSAICLSPDEKTVYGANRFSESLIFFGVNEDGTLYEKLRHPCDGDRPRHMYLTRDGKLLIVCYQISNEVYVMPIGENGLPVPGAAWKFPFANAAAIAEC